MIGLIQEPNKRNNRTYIDLSFIFETVLLTTLTMNINNLDITVGNMLNSTILQCIYEGYVNRMRIEEG